MKNLFTSLFLIFVGLYMLPAHADTQSTAKIHIVKLHTNHGVISLQLDAIKAPITVKNFEDYVTSGHYNGTLFHRVIADFMIQGGGFEPGMIEKPVNAPIKNEANNGLINVKYTIAMAHIGDPQSATAQFVINIGHNTHLNFKDPTPTGYGYCVFGKVIEGKDVVDKIGKVKTGYSSGQLNVPSEDVIIIKAEIAR